MRIPAAMTLSLILALLPLPSTADGEHPHPSLENRIKVIEDKLSQPPAPVSQQQLRDALRSLLGDAPTTEPTPPVVTPPSEPPVVVVPPSEPPPPTFSAATYADCKAKLVNGGWCEMRVPGDKPSISSVYPVYDDSLHGVVGPRAVLGAWGGMAYDPESKCMWFSGGGHADSGGNEVYQFCLENGKWERLTDPSPLTHVYNDGGQWRLTVDYMNVPRSSHTRDGLLWNAETKTIIYLAAHPGYNAGQTRVSSPGDLPQLDPALTVSQYEFNPSKVETRNGLAPLSWRRLDIDPALAKRLAYGRSAQWPDGEIWLAGTSNTYRLVPGGLEQIRSYGSIGEGVMSYDPKRKLMWSNMKSGRNYYLWATNREGVRTVFYDNVPEDATRSLTVDDDGMLWAWNGVGVVYRFDPDNPANGWKRYGGGHTDGEPKRTFSKWEYLGDGYFGGISKDSTGFWIFRPTGGGQTIEATDPQTFIDNAKAGSEVTIPPGIYTHGIYVNKSLTVNLSGVELHGVEGGKGVVSIECTGCTVVINDLLADGKTASAQSSNVAGVRITGTNWNVTVNRATIRFTPMGILTDNKGGTLTINDSVLDRMGGGSSLSHAIYAGSIHKLAVNNTTVLAPQQNGHLLKSRADETSFTNGRLLGLDGMHSRLVDIACGGDVTLQNNLIQQGTNTDNAEMMMIGGEMHKPANCSGDSLPAKLDFTGNIFVFDRDSSDDERAKGYGHNFLMGWRGGTRGHIITGNRIVTKPAKKFFFVGTGGVELNQDELLVANTIYPNRQAAGLNPDDNTVP